MPSVIGVFDHPWLGGFFGDAPMQALWSADAQIAHMLIFEAAWSRALGETGRVPPALAASAGAHIAAFVPDIEGLRAGTGRDGLPVPALVAQLREGRHDAGAIHTGATSQDVLDSALALTLREATDLLIGALVRLGDRLDCLDRDHGGNAMTGRTRMQSAARIAVSDRIATWRMPLKAHLERLDGQRARVELVQVGGAAGNRAGLGAAGGAMAASMAAALGLGNPPRAWHAMRDGLAEYAGTLSLIAGTTGKMGQDVCLMAQQGVDELSLCSGGVSSSMPHKRNPVLAELMVTLARFNAVQVSAMHHATIHEQERSGAAWGLEWMVLPQICVATARSLGAAAELCDAVTSMGHPDV